MNMTRPFRYLLLLICAVQIIFAVAFFFQLPFALALWPLPGTTPLSYTLVASFFAAAAASTLWCVLAREYSALAGVGLDYVVIFAPMGIVAFQMGTDTANNALMLFGFACAVGAIFGLGLLMWGYRIPIRDSRRLPRLVRTSFLAFVVALLIAGWALITKLPNILPWSVTPELSVIFGWMFLGAAAYFVFGLLRPVWSNAVGQLMGFLAYDLVLIVPFLQRLPTIAPELRLSLIVYIVIVVYSGLLAIYYLFINPVTRVKLGR
jgi:hypothetical protein